MFVVAFMQYGEKKRVITQFYAIVCISVFNVIFFSLLRSLFCAAEFVIIQLIKQFVVCWEQWQNAFAPCSAINGTSYSNVSHHQMNQEITLYTKNQHKNSLHFSIYSFNCISYVIMEQCFEHRSIESLIIQLHL